MPLEDLAVHHTHPQPHSLENKLADEGHLLLGARNTIGRGFGEQMKDYKEHPLHLVETVVEGAAIGAAFVASKGTALAKFLPTAMTAGAASELLYKPMKTVWDNHDALKKEQEQLGLDVGAFGAQSLVMLPGAIVGGKIMSRTIEMRAPKQAGITELIDSKPGGATTSDAAPPKAPAYGSEARPEVPLVFREGTPSGKAWGKIYDQVFPEVEKVPKSDLTPDGVTVRDQAHLAGNNKLVGAYVHSGLGEIEVPGQGSRPVEGLWYLMVDPKYQSKGIGGRLYEHTLGKIFSQKAGTIAIGENEHTGLNFEKMDNVPAPKEIRAALASGDLSTLGPQAEGIPTDNAVQAHRRLAFYLEQGERGKFPAQYIRKPWYMPDSANPDDGAWAHLRVITSDGKPLPYETVRQTMIRMYTHEYGYGLGEDHPLVQALKTAPAEEFGMISPKGK